MDFVGVFGTGIFDFRTLWALFKAALVSSSSFFRPAGVVDCVNLEEDSLIFAAIDA